LFEELMKSVSATSSPSSLLTMSFQSVAISGRRDESSPSLNPQELFLCPLLSRHLHSNHSRLQLKGQSLSLPPSPLSLSLPLLSPSLSSLTSLPCFSVAVR
jgi:hypothetical protein